MPRRQIPVRWQYHSQGEHDIRVRVQDDIFSVVVRDDLLLEMSNKEVTDIALMVAIWARRESQCDDIFVNEKFGAQLRNTCRNNRRHRAAWAHTAPVDDGQYSHANHYLEIEEARNKAQALLRAIDPELSKKVESGKAFYFTTPFNRYIWYPNQRAIVWLGPDEPKYVCVHSRDHSVESNTYDWAITMKTYLLGNEEHLRSVANFHSEYYHRGNEGDYHNVALQDVGGIEGVLTDIGDPNGGDPEDEGSVPDPLGADGTEDPRS